MGNKFEIKDLNLYYGDYHALKNINMDLAENEITAFIGPSGCGKSTFLKCLNRMNDLVEGCKITGSVTLDGEDIYGNMDVNKLRKRVGMVFQKPNPFPKTIYENVAYGLRVNGVNDENYIEETVVKTLKQVVLWDEVKDKLKESAFALSGGQQQRCAIARALIKNPSLLLCDEPTGALDSRTSRDILILLEDINRQYGTTMLIVTHNNSIKNMVHQVIMIKDGQISKNYRNEKRVPAAELEDL